VRASPPLYVHTTNPTADIEDVGQQLIEDNIVSVSRQMIDKEASVPKSNSRQNGQQPSGDDVDMEE
jgi:26S proteasome regulatory subunit N11